VDSSVPHTVFAPSIVYAPGDPWLRLLDHLALLPAMPISGSGSARYQPIWAEDVADCVLAALAGRGDGRDRYELAGPDVLSYDEIVRLALRAAGRRRRLVHVPVPLVRRALRALEAVAGLGAFATWEEAELMEVAMTTPRGTADAQALGVTPRPMAAVLGLA
jgi:NADH dehydrogenase